jgi:hypothetical protein
VSPFYVSSWAVPPRHVSRHVSVWAVSPRHVSAWAELPR